MELAHFENVLNFTTRRFVFPTRKKISLTSGKQIEPNAEMQKKRIYFKRKGFISKEKYFYTRRKGFLHLKEKDLFEKKSDQKKRKENHFYQPA